MVAPACTRCNNLASRDDENFRLMLVSQESGKGNPARDELFKTAMRSLKYPEARGLASSFFSSIQEVERITPSGIYAGRGLIKVMDGARLDRVARRIVQGIFFNENDRRVPDDHAVNVIQVSRFSSFDPVMREGIEEFAALTLAEKEKNFGPAFSYWYFRSPAGPSRAHVMLSFYGVLEYYGNVQPIQVSDEEIKEAEGHLASLYREKGLEPPGWTSGRQDRNQGPI
jgi:hypothetical protein